MEHLAQEDPVPQSLSQVKNSGRGPHYPVVRWQHFAIDQPSTTLSPFLHPDGKKDQHFAIDQPSTTLSPFLHPDGKKDREEATLPPKQGPTSRSRHVLCGTPAWISA
ncbi:hypothetical protein EOD39_19706 [Acipenser ruthenus]|uniref:Uncharacterized protein n=1 Tax=Acipenser ruthenus TaxID=7906 RepID=A0A444UXG8_ACIRT|nr:hypothetical protein EOD39_19706 [Acipenser ruthenus]